jgi:hypothetical protein
MDWYLTADPWIRVVLLSWFLVALIRERRRQ